MDGSSLVFIVMPIVIAVCLGVMIALPYLGGRQEARASAAARRPEAGATAPPNAPAAGAPSAAAPIAVTLAASPESPAE